MTIVIKLNWEDLSKATKEGLNNLLEWLIEAEDYEKAIKVRDELRRRNQ